jgi:hypothetical protein
MTDVITARLELHLPILAIDRHSRGLVHAEAAAGQ